MTNSISNSTNSNSSNDHNSSVSNSNSSDEFDRDLVWMFAEGFGHAYERTVLLQRLRALRQEVRRANHSILAVMDEFCDAEVEVARLDGDVSKFVTPDVKQRLYQKLGRS